MIIKTEAVRTAHILMNALLYSSISFVKARELSAVHFISTSAPIAEYARVLSFFKITTMALLGVANGKCKPFKNSGDHLLIATPSFQFLNLKT